MESRTALLATGPSAVAVKPTLHKAMRDIGPMELSSENKSNRCSKDT